MLELFRKEAPYWILAESHYTVILFVCSVLEELMVVLSLSAAHSFRIHMHF